jgi:hypothetical protein
MAEEQNEIREEVMEELQRNGTSLDERIRNSEAFKKFLGFVEKMNTYTIGAKNKVKEGDVEAAALELANMKLAKDGAYAAMTEFPGNNNDPLNVMNQNYFPTLRDYLVNKFEGAIRIIELNLSC